MPFQAERDTTLPRVIATRKDPATGERKAIYESVNYVRGAVIFEEDIAPHVLSRLEDGDDHLSSLVRYIDEAEARKILGEQYQGHAAQPVDEGEILHQEERLGSEGTVPPSPAVNPTEITQEPEFEAPQVSDSGTSSEEDVSSASTEEQEQVAEGSQEETATTIEEQGSEDTAEAQEDPQGSSESSGDAETETSTEDSGSTEDQENGQGQTDETQEESTEEAGATSSEEQSSRDRFDEMDLPALKAEAKEKKIAGRSKMKTEEALREALRAQEQQ